ncbi:MAG: ComEC/Rec2 family competence protein [Magnetovibrionaceae bacterium]
MSEFMREGQQSFRQAFGGLGSSFAQGIRPVGLPILLGIGVVIYFRLPIEPAPWVVLVSLVLGALGLLFARLAGTARILILSLCLVTLGLGLGGLRTLSVAAPVLERATGPTWVEGRLARVEPLTDGVRVTLDSVRIDRIRPADTPVRVRLTAKGKQPALHPGDWLRLRGELRPPPPPSAPGAFDFQRQMFFQSIGAVGFVYGPARISTPYSDAPTVATWENGFGLAEALQNLRTALTRRLLAGLEGDAGAVAAALITGERRAIPEEVTEALRDAGLAHLLAISGLHIGLVTGLFFGGIRLILAFAPAVALRFPTKKIAAAIALPAALCYCLIAGATVPSLRAFLMVGLMLLAVLVDRRAISLRAVAIAASLILIFWPESLLGASFQMSFAAVVVLVAGYEQLTDRGWMVSRRDSGVWGQIGLYMAGIAITTLLAGLATAPFAAYHFNRIADYGLLANLAAVPLTGLWIMPAGLFSLLLMPFGLEEWGLAVMGFGIDLVIAIAKGVAGLPGATRQIPALSDLAFGLILVGGLWAVLVRGRGRLLGLAGPVLALVLVINTPSPMIFVDSEARLMAVRLGDEIFVNSRQIARFDRDVWQRRLGLTAAQRWETNGRPRTQGEASLRCDIHACRLTVHNRVISLIRHPAALADDCRGADLVISLEPVSPGCRAETTVIDRFDLWRGGALSVTLTDTLRKAGQFQLRQDKIERGNRPWVPQSGRPRPKDGV